MENRNWFREQRGGMLCIIIETLKLRDIVFGTQQWGNSWKALREL